MSSVMHRSETAESFASVISVATTGYGTEGEETFQFINEENIELEDEHNFDTANKAGDNVFNARWRVKPETNTEASSPSKRRSSTSATPKPLPPPSSRGHAKTPKSPYLAINDSTPTKGRRKSVSTPVRDQPIPPASVLRRSNRRASLAEDLGSGEQVTSQDYVILDHTTRKQRKPASPILTPVSLVKVARKASASQAIPTQAIEQKNKELEAFRKATDKEIKSNHELHQQALKAKDTEITALKESLEKRIAIAERNREAARRKAEEMSADITRLEQKDMESCKRVDDLREDISSLDSSFRSVKQEKEQLSLSHSKIEEQLRTVQEENQHLRASYMAEVAQVQREAAEKQAQREQLLTDRSNEIRSLESHTEALKEENKSSRNKLAAALVGQKSAEEELETWKTRAQNYSSKIFALQSKLDSSTEKVTSLDSQVNTLKVEISQVSGERDAALASQRAAEEERDALKIKIQESSSQNSRLQADLDASESTVDELSKTMEGISANAAEAAQASRQKEAHLEEEKACSQGQVTELKDHLRKLARFDSEMQAWLQACHKLSA